MPSFYKKAAPERSLSQNDPHWTQKNDPNLTTDTLPTNPFLNRMLPKCNDRYKPRKGLSQPSNDTLP